MEAETGETWARLEKVEEQEGHEKHPMRWWAEGGKDGQAPVMDMADTAAQHQRSCVSKLQRAISANDIGVVREYLTKSTVGTGFQDRWVSA